MRKPGLCVLLALLVFFVTSVYAENRLVERDGPVSIEHEPVLQTDKLIYVKDNQLFFKKAGSDSVALSEKGPIYSFDMAVMDNVVLVAWSQSIRKSGKNLCMFRISLDNGKTWKGTVELLSGAVFPLVRVKSSEVTGKFAISVQDSDKKKIYIYTLDQNGEIKDKYKIAPEKARILFFHDVLLKNDSVLIFAAVLKEGTDVTEIIKYAFSKNYTNGILKGTLYSGKSPAGFISCGECDSGRDFLIVKYAAGKYSRLSLFVSRTETIYDEVVLCDGEDVARADFVPLGSDRLFIVYSSEIPKKSKQRVFALIVDCAKSRILNRLKLDNTYSNTTAWLPVVARLNSSLLVTWEDTRNIRSNIYAAYSPDAGKSWTYKNVELSSKRRFAFRPRVSTYNSSFYVAWMEWDDDSRTRVNVTLFHIPLAKANSIFSRLKEQEVIITRAEKRHLLEQRIKEYWKALKMKDYRKSYSFFDPFYRAVVPYEVYAARMGHIEYNDWKIKEVQVVGNEGIVKAAVRYKVKNLPVSGKIYSSGLKEGKIEDVWIFVDGQWFKKFIDYLSGGSSVKY